MCLHDYSETTQVFVPRQSNSTLIMHPNDESDGGLGATNATQQYRFSLHANATLYFGVFELNNPASVSTWDCNITGHPIFEAKSTEFNETLLIGPGSYAYMMCNRGRETASGEFQYSVLTTFVTKPRYGVGSFLYIGAGLLSVWGIFLLPEALSPRSKSGQYSRFLRWALLAPVILLFASVCCGGGISAGIMGVHVDALSLAIASFKLIMTNPGMLFAALRAPLLLVCFLALLVTANVSLFAYVLRVRWRRRRPRASHPRRLYNLVMSLFDPLSKWFAPLVLPDSSHIGVFVRLGIVSLFTAQVFTMSP
jgi:hypothetical protein